MFDTTPEQLKAELTADIKALTSGSTLPEQADNIQCQPAVLRKLAALIAAELDPGCQRVLCAHDDIPLGTAVSLHTGLPLVIETLETTASTSSDGWVGEHHDGEHIQRVALFPRAGAIAAFELLGLWSAE